MPVSTLTRIWDTPILAAAGLALTFPCGGKVSRHPALKICTLSDGGVSRSLAGTSFVREYAWGYSWVPLHVADVVVALYLLDFIDTEDMDVFYYTKTAPAQVAADFHLVCHCFHGRETNVSWIESHAEPVFLHPLSL